MRTEALGNVPAGISVAGLALKYASELEEVSVALIGARGVDQVSSLLRHRT